MSKKKWYVIWKGIEPGIYDNWEDCKRFTANFEGALYMSFSSFEEAREAYESSPWEYLGKGKKKSFSGKNTSETIRQSLSVDAACSGNPGKMEYRGVYTETGEEIFHKGPFEWGTNNIGEFLALVHGLALLKQQNSPLPIYSDSVNAISWVKQKKCKTKLEPNEKNKSLFELIRRAEIWLNSNTYSTPILKWNTKEWGEIPADFGRK
ncbi:viroplasmin family protein [Bacteroidales bacterium OttesenSCG-928-M06]|nr:viroplasmin family protein [Bacteroidales bacterium OttesenSCG-928-M06]